MKILLEVTRDDIDNGIRSSASTCPIALALIREVRKITNDEPYEVEVDGSFSFYLDNQKYNARKSYIELDEFVKRFDAEDYVAPFTLAVEADEYEPEEYYEE